MKHFLLSLLMVISCAVLRAQDWAHYTPFLSKGPVPQDFTDVYINKYASELKNISHDNSNKTRRRQDDFYRQSEYFINEFLVSGKVSYGDTLTRYCDHILDILLQHNPALRSQIRVYVAKSPEVNALTTNSGIIFVNTGLIAQVENEAQLAYVLSHEIIHFEKKHTLNEYIEEERIRNGEDLYRKSDLDEKIEALSTYSKAQEEEADTAGYSEYFKNSDYNLQAALNVMDVLQYSYLPFDEIPFDASVLEKGNFKFPAGFLLDETAPITADGDYDDSKSSHPNIKKRKTELHKIVTNAGKGREYILSKDAFKYCQRLARYEDCRQYLTHREYPQAIYSSFLLGREYGTDYYQQLTIAKALDAATRYRSDNDLYKIMDDWHDVEGYSQQVYYLLHKMNKEQLNTLAVSYSYNLVRKDTTDEAAKRLFKNSLKNLVFNTGLKPDDFKKEMPDTSFTLDSLQLKKLSHRSSKIASITKEKAEDDKESNDNFYKYAFVGFWKDPFFTDTFDKYAEQAEKGNYHELRPNQSDKYKRKNDALGINRIVCVTPQYLKLDERERNGIRYITTDERLQNYKNQLNNLAGRVGLDMTMLDYKTLSPDDSDEFNDLSLLKSWIGERIAHSNSEAVVSDFNYMNYLREKYHTDYIAYTGNLSLRIREDNVAGKLMGSLIIWPLLPFTIADLLIPDYQSFNYFFVFDLRNGAALLADYNYYPTNDKNDYLRSIIYNDLIQIKDKPGKRK